jgi:hypothetical protein
MEHDMAQKCMYNMTCQPISSMPCHENSCMHVHCIYDIAIYHVYMSFVACHDIHKLPLCHLKKVHMTSNSL